MHSCGLRQGGYFGRLRQGGKVEQARLFNFFTSRLNPSEKSPLEKRQVQKNYATISGQIPDKIIVSEIMII